MVQEVLQLASKKQDVLFTLEEGMQESPLTWNCESQQSYKPLLVDNHRQHRAFLINNWKEFSFINNHSMSLEDNFKLQKPWQPTPGSWGKRPCTESQLKHIQTPGPEKQESVSIVLICSFWS